MSYKLMSYVLDLSSIYFILKAKILRGDTKQSVCSDESVFKDYQVTIVELFNLTNAWKRIGLKKSNVFKILFFFGNLWQYR